MDAKPKRRLWQIHLLTILLLSFVADGLIVVNLRAAPTTTTVKPWSDPSTGEKGLSAWSKSSRGWPCTIMEIDFGNNYPQAELTRMGIKNNDDLIRMNADVPDWNPFMGAWHWDGLLPNIFTSLSIIVIFAFLCEQLVRRTQLETHGKRIWQIHLLTGVLLMFTAGALLRINIGEFMTDNDNGRMERHWLIGWPFWILKHDDAAVFAIVFDTQFAISILCSVACISEWSLRRREARKPG